jgi:hypothetical protein
MTRVNLIVNGGEPLKDCPKDWDKAKKWADKANQEHGPQWEWDCGYKLDYDGPIFRVSSRFYPPKSHYGETWDGTVTIYYYGEEIAKKEFDCQSLEQLKTEVEEYVRGFRKRYLFDKSINLQIIIAILLVLLAFCAYFITMLA